MERDRYQQNHGLFVVAMVSLLFCMGLLFFSGFLFPYLMLGWIYNVPEFIIDWREWLISDYGFNLIIASHMVFMFFSVPAIICGIIAYYTSTRIENQIYTDEGNSQLDVIKKPFFNKDSLMFLFKLLVILGAVFIAILGLHWLISLSSY